MGRYAIGIDVGGTKTVYGFFDETHRPIAKKWYATNRELGPEAFFDEMIKGIAALLREQRLDLSRVRGIGVGMPSYIDFQEGYISKGQQPYPVEGVSCKGVSPAAAWA